MATKIQLKHLFKPLVNYISSDWSEGGVWPSTTNNNRAAVLNQVSRAKVANRLKSHECVTLTWCNETKFCWCRLTFKISYMHTNLCNDKPLKDGTKTKSITVMHKKHLSDYGWFLAPCDKSCMTPAPAVVKIFARSFRWCMHLFWKRVMEKPQDGLRWGNVFICGWSCLLIQVIYNHQRKHKTF